MLVGFKPFVEMSLIYHEDPKEDMHHIKYVTYMKCFESAFQNYDPRFLHVRAVPPNKLH